MLTDSCSCFGFTADLAAGHNSAEPLQVVKQAAQLCKSVAAPSTMQCPCTQCSHSSFYLAQSTAIGYKTYHHCRSNLARPFHARNRLLRRPNRRLNHTQTLRHPNLQVTRAILPVACRSFLNCVVISYEPLRDMHTRVPLHYATPKLRLPVCKAQM